MEERQVGVVDHFFDKISVCMVKLNDVVKVGDKIRIKGKGPELVQDVNSMQIDRVPTQEAKAGDMISIKVDQKVRQGDTVYKVV